MEIVGESERRPDACAIVARERPQEASTCAEAGEHARCSRPTLLPCGDEPAWVRPLHHAVHGPPPRSGEDLSASPSPTSTRTKHEREALILPGTGRGTATP